MRYFTLAALLICSALLIAPAAAPAMEAGAAAPEFELPVFDSDKTFKMSEMKGKKGLVLSFTQSACASCQAELHFLNSFVGTSDKFDVYTINVDVRGGTEKWNDLMKNILEKQGLTMGVLLDPKYTVPPMFGVRATPSAVVIDKEGKIVGAMTGYSPGADNDTISKWVDKIK